MAVEQKHFEEELKEFKEKLLTMGSHAERSVSKALRALTERDENLALQVQADDDIIDRLEIDLDEYAIHLLTKAPLASDLRLVTVAAKLSQNLERIGDEATTIARRAIDLAHEPPLDARVDIAGMAKIALQMLKDALDCFVKKDPAAARALIPRDKEVDAINRSIHGQLSNIIVENPASISRCLNLMTVSKSLERVADHAKNIAEEVVYFCEARDIRHEGRVG